MQWSFEVWKDASSPRETDTLPNWMGGGLLTIKKSLLGLTKDFCCVAAFTYFKLMRDLYYWSPDQCVCVCNAIIRKILLRR